MEEEINPLAQKIMSLLVFEESFENILNDLRDENKYAVADEIKQLIVKDLIKPCKDLLNLSKSGLVYDSDQMRTYSFILTSKGISTLESKLKKQ